MAKQNLAFRIKIEIAVERPTERCELSLEALQGPRRPLRFTKVPDSSQKTHVFDNSTHPVVLCLLAKKGV
jgi:hypothetical protein